MHPVRRDALLIGAAAALISAAGNASPSIWYDEAVTVGAATRSWPALAGLLGHLDAVHGVYYAVLHLLFQVLPYSPFLLRLPSALAVGGCAALLVGIGTRLDRRRTGRVAGAIAALLPALTWAGGEGRSSAITALLATATTAALLLALRLERQEAPDARRRRLAWLGYGLLAALTCAVFLDAVLVVVAHLVTAAILRARSVDAGRTGPLLPRGQVVAAAAAAVVDAPLFLTAWRQSGQIAWVHGLDGTTWWRVLEMQAFPSSPLYAALALALLAAGVVAAVRNRRQPARLRRSGPFVLIAVALPWVVVPTAVLLGATALGLHLYLPRYLTMSAPGTVLLLAVALERLSKRAAIAAVVALAILGVPQLVGSRLPQAKQQSTWSAVAASVAADPWVRAAGPPLPVVYGPLAGHTTATTHAVATAYPADFVRTIDVTAIRPLTDTPRLWEPRRTLAGSIGRLGRAHRLLLVEDTTAGGGVALADVLAGAGYHAERTSTFGPIAVTAYAR